MTVQEIKKSVLSDVDSLREWKDRVLERDGNVCINCESTNNVVPCFVIPPEAGGKVRMANGVSVCRECRISAEGARVLPLRIDQKTPLNFLCSRKLYEAVEDYVHNGSGYGSISALVRRLISSFITETEMYQDIGQWQDQGSDVKINGWVSGGAYGVFKQMCAERGLTYTDALKALLLMTVSKYQEKKDGCSSEQGRP